MSESTDIPQFDLDAYVAARHDIAALEALGLTELSPSLLANKIYTSACNAVTKLESQFSSAILREHYQPLSNEELKELTLRWKKIIGVGLQRKNRLQTSNQPTTVNTQLTKEIEMSDSSTSQQLEAPTYYALVDITNLEATSFLVRATLEQIVAWNQIYASEGKVTKRLDLINDAETLQYLFYNTTGEAPPNDLADLQARCFELSTKLAIDETSVETLNERIPPDMRKNAGSNQEGGIYSMGQGSKVEGALGKESAPKQKAAGKSAEEKAAEKAAKDAAKAEAKAKRDAEREAKKAAKANEQPATVDKTVIDKAFGAVTDQAAAIAKAQEAYLALEPRKDGGRSADSRSYAVQLNLKHSAETGPVPTKVSVMWFASVVSGLKTAQFYRRDAINLIRRLGLVPLQDGVEIPVKPEKPAAPANAPATGETAATTGAAPAATTETQAAPTA